MSSMVMPRDGRSLARAHTAAVQLCWWSEGPAQVGSMRGQDVAGRVRVGHSAGPQWPETARPWWGGRCGHLAPLVFQSRTAARLSPTASVGWWVLPGTPLGGWAGSQEAVWLGVLRHCWARNRGMGWLGHQGCGSVSSLSWGWGASVAAALGHVEGVASVCPQGRTCRPLGFPASKCVQIPSGTPCWPGHDSESSSDETRRKDHEREEEGRWPSPLWPRCLLSPAWGLHVPGFPSNLGLSFWGLIFPICLTCRGMWRRRCHQVARKLRSAPVVSNVAGKTCAASWTGPPAASARHRAL